MNKKLEGRRATSNNPTGLSLASPANNAYLNQSQTIQQNDNSARSGGGGSPAQSLNSIQKINQRLRARGNNPVVMSMNQSPQMLLPMSQRSLSPGSYQQLQTQQPDSRGNMLHHPT